MSRAKNQRVKVNEVTQGSAPKKANLQKGGTNPIQMLNTTEIDKLSEIYDYFDHNGDGALVSVKSFKSRRLYTFSVYYPFDDSLIHA